MMYNKDTESEVIKMIKCPNCGSTAQVKENTPFVSKDGEYINAKYKCGCGCYFDIESDFDNSFETKNLFETS